jgi:hypothetical protein
MAKFCAIKKSLAQQGKKMESIEKFFSEAKELKEKYFSLPEDGDERKNSEKYPHLVNLWVKEEMNGEEGLVYYMACSLIKGQPIADQYRLFPMDQTFGSIEKVISQFSGIRGDFKIALGTYYQYDCGCYYKWHSVLSFPRCFAELFRYKFVGNHIQITNIDELRVLGIEFPETSKEYPDTCVYLSNILIAELEQQAENTPEVLGWYTGDFGGYGSRIRNPFLFEKQDFQRLGFMAVDVYGEKSMNSDYEYHYSKKFLEEYFEKFTMKGLKVTHAEGNYAGRGGGNSWNKGLKDQKETILNSPEDLKIFGYLGVRILKIERV